MLNQATTPQSIAASEDAYDRKNRRHRCQSISTKFAELGVIDKAAQANIIYLVGSSRELDNCTQQDLGNLEAFLANRIRDRAIGISTFPALAA
ncbi:MAG: hypothetical protein AAF708_00400 [Deinococcota bacterium]